eukprot:scaffold49288_cov63-Phaeocystis_antarctica.AAC.8
MQQKPVLSPLLRRLLPLRCQPLLAPRALHEGHAPPPAPPARRGCAPPAQRSPRAPRRPLARSAAACASPRATWPPRGAGWRAARQARRTAVAARASRPRATRAAVSLLAAPPAAARPPPRPLRPPPRLGAAAATRASAPLRASDDLGPSPVAPRPPGRLLPLSPARQRGLPSSLPPSYRASPLHQAQGRGQHRGRWCACAALPPPARPRCGA